MNNIRKVITFATLFLVVSCGFRPLYKMQDEVNNNLAKIQIEPINYGKLGQNLYLNLQEILNPSSLDTKPEYRLKINLRKFTDAAALQSDNFATRYNTTVEAEYELEDLKTLKIIDKQKVSAVGSYDIVSSEYATYVAEEDAALNNTRELAQEIKALVIRAISEQ